MHSSGRPITLRRCWPCSPLPWAARCTGWSARNGRGVWTLADSWAGVLLAGWLVAPIAVAFIESWVLLPIVQVRYLLVCLPPVYLLLARAVTSLPAPDFGKWAVAAVLIAGGLVVLVGPLDYYGRPHKQQFREAAAYVVQHDPGYPDTLIVGSVSHWDYLNYYFEQMGSPHRTDLLASRAEELPALVEALQARRPRYVWLVAAHLTPAPELVAYLDSHLTPVDHRQLFGAAVWLYKNNAGGGVVLRGFKRVDSRSVPSTLSGAGPSSARRSRRVRPGQNTLRTLRLRAAALRSGCSALVVSNGFEYTHFKPARRCLSRTGVARCWPNGRIRDSLERPTLHPRRSDDTTTRGPNDPGHRHQRRVPVAGVAPGAVRPGGAGAAAGPWGWLIPALLALAADTVIRAERWSVLLRPLASISWRRLISPTVIGYMGNAVLPARLGELLKVTLLGRILREVAPGKAGVGNSTSAALGNIALERTLDGVVSVAILAVTVWFVPHPDWLTAGMDWVAALSAVAWWGWWGWSSSGAKVIGLLHRLFGHFAWAARPLHRADHLLSGLEALRNPWLVARALFWSVAVWGVGALEFYFVIRAFHLPLGLLQAAFLMVGIGLATVIPSTPATLGTFELASMALLALLGIDQAARSAYPDHAPDVERAAADRRAGFVVAHGLLRAQAGTSRAAGD